MLALLLLMKHVNLLLELLSFSNAVMMMMMMVMMMMMMIVLVFRSAELKVTEAELIIKAQIQ